MLENVLKWSTDSDTNLTVVRLVSLSVLHFNSVYPLSSFHSPPVHTSLYEHRKEQTMDESHFGFVKFS